jgi:hypothetical protein
VLKNGASRSWNGGGGSGGWVGTIRIVGWKRRRRHGITPSRSWCCRRGRSVVGRLWLVERGGGNREGGVGGGCGGRVSSSIGLLLLLLLLRVVGIHGLKDPKSWSDVWSEGEREERERERRETNNNKQTTNKPPLRDSSPRVPPKRT